MNQSYDAFLIECLSEYKQREFAHIPAEEDIDYEFSEKFLRKTEKLIKRAGSSYWCYVNTAAKRAAVIILCVIITSASLMSVEAVRKTVLDFFYKIYETNIKITDKIENKKTSITNYYTITNIPNEYTVHYKSFMKTLDFAVTWKNHNNQKIFFYQSLPKDGSSTSINNNDTATEKIVNDTPCLEIISETEYQYHWEFDGYIFTLIYPVELGEEFAEDVIGKLIETDPENYP